MSCGRPVCVCMCIRHDKIGVPVYQTRTYSVHNSGVDAGVGGRDRPWQISLKEREREWEGEKKRKKKKDWKKARNNFLVLNSSSSKCVRLCWYLEEGMGLWFEFSTDFKGIRRDVVLLFISIDYNHEKRMFFPTTSLRIPLKVCDFNNLFLR